MTDVVYVLGSGSSMNNLELAYSLASVERYLGDYRNIYVIGNHPGFEGNFIHIPAEDKSYKLKQLNIRKKIEIACEHPDISDPFLFMNDDHILLTPILCSDFKYYYNTNLAKMWLGKRKNGHYKLALHNTLVTLSEKDLPIKHYDIHIPILYHKEKFLQAMAKHDWGRMGEFVIKSLYCNTVGVEPYHHIDPKVVQHYQMAEDIEREVKDWFVFSFDDVSLSEGMLKYLDQIFPAVKNTCVH